MAVKQAVVTEMRKRRPWRALSSWEHVVVAPPPPLVNGDRLTRYEFERRYQALPHLKKAELIEGVVYIAPSLRNRPSQAKGWTVAWLGIYSAFTPGTSACDNATVRLDLDNEAQPDALLRLDETLGGRSRVGPDDYIEGAPELIAKTAASSASYDLHDEMNTYRRNGVQEYLVWRVYDEELDWFHLHEGRYLPLAPDAGGVIHSQVFPGLWLHVEAMLAGDLARVLAELQKGLETEEHEVFIERLSPKRKPGE